MMHCNLADSEVMLIVAVIDLFIVLTTGINEPNYNSSLIVSVPLGDCIGSQYINLKRGEEILIAAQAAVNGVNNDSSILSSHDLQLIPFDSCEDKNEIIQQLLAVTYYESSQSILGLTGFFSHKTVSLLLPLVRQKRIVMTLLSEIFVYRNYGKGILAMSSPFSMANVLLSYVKKMNWERLGLITESTDSYFFDIAASLLQIAKVNKTVVISPYIELQGLESAIRKIVSYNTKIVIVSLPARRVAQMICLIDEMGLLWPDYAWIFHSYKIEYFSDLPAACHLDKAIRGIVMIESQIKPNHPEAKLTSNVTFFEHDLSSLLELADIKNEHSVLAHITYDLVLLTAIELNKSCYQSNANQLNTQDPISYNMIQQHYNIFHIWGWNKVLIGKVYSNLSITIVNKTVLEAAPKDDLPLNTSIDPPIGYTIGTGLLIVFLASFVTLTLTLYICFRKQPEIKATSFTISLFLFAGCYFNLLYLMLLVYFDHPAFNAHSTQYQNAVCNILQWFSAIGISLALMISTLLVKMLRVYHIFNCVTIRIGRYCSDLALMIYILFILVPNITVNLVWLFIDQYHAVIEYKTRKGYLEVSKDCSSKYESIWSGVLSVYLLLLALASAVVAIMTRKVRLQHFKDTKKVNILVFVLCLGIILTFSYWLLFQMLDAKPYIVSIPLIIGHSIVILSFLVLLFIPKVFPPFWRYVNQRINIQQSLLHSYAKSKQGNTVSELQSKRNSSDI